MDNLEELFTEQEHKAAKALYENISLRYGGFVFTWDTIGEARKRHYLEDARAVIRCLK